MKKSFGIELTPEQVSFLYVRFNVCTDAQLRNVLQKVVDDMITRQSPTSRDIKIELEDFNEMRSKIRRW